MESMTKIYATGTHFELVNGKRLSKAKVVQIWPKKLYDNAEGFAVFLCEVEDESEDLKG